MEASLAYTAKKPIISDDEYDQLKAQLREQSSKVVRQVRQVSLIALSAGSAAPASGLSLA